ncbi:MAG: DUF1559 domain-containing protein [Lentisphaerae bacterium]|nr:MAG: DUF1559 domain-containing protein [Lentisphaerota bacterium]
MQPYDVQMESRKKGNVVHHLIGKLKPVPGYRCFGEFTMIELLIVITILMVLAALLLPALTRAMVVARRTTCINNQRQVMLAFSNYAADFEAHIPFVNHPYDCTGTGCENHGYRINTPWFFFLLPYMGYEHLAPWEMRDYLTPMDIATSVLRCPVFPAENVTLLKCGMGRNNWIPPRGPKDGGANRTAIFGQFNMIKDSEKRILIADGDDTSLGKEDTSFQPAHFDPNSPYLKFDFFRHANTVNVLFVDGHVRSFRAEYVYVNTERTEFLLE